MGIITVSLTGSCHEGLLHCTLLNMDAPIGQVVVENIAIEAQAHIAIFVNMLLKPSIFQVLNYEITCGIIIGGKLNGYGYLHGSAFISFLWRDQFSVIQSPAFPSLHTKVSTARGFKQGDDRFDRKLFVRLQVNEPLLAAVIALAS